MLGAISAKWPFSSHHHLYQRPKNMKIIHNTGVFLTLFNLDLVALKKNYTIENFYQLVFYKIVKTNYTPKFGENIP